MFRSLFFFILLAFAVVACNDQGPTTAQAADNNSEKVESPGQSFGRAISAENAIPYAELAKKMQHTDSLAIKVRATVQEVCQAKGCWMNIASPRSEAEAMMVQFEDYKFFVPKDISGREVIVEGYAYRDLTPVEDLRHFAKDAGKSQTEIEAITEPEEELKFLASGVILLDKNQQD